MVENYRYLGVFLGSTLDWKCNPESVYKNKQSKLYFLRKLGSFSFFTKMLCVFYRPVVESAIYFAASVGAAVSEPETLLGTALEPLGL